MAVELTFGEKLELAEWLYDYGELSYADEVFDVLRGLDDHLMEKWGFMLLCKEQIDFELRRLKNLNAKLVEADFTANLVWFRIYSPNKLYVKDANELLVLLQSLPNDYTGEQFLRDYPE